MGKMKNVKFSLLLSVAFLFFCPLLHAGTAIGVEGGSVFGVYHGNESDYALSLTFKTDSLPFIISARSEIADKKLCAAGLVFDMWLANPVIGYSIFHWFYGPGFTLSYQNKIDDDKLDFTQSRGLFAAPRFVLGLNSFLTDFSELYMQAALEPGLVFDQDEGFIFRVNLPLSCGLRLWF